MEFKDSPLQQIDTLSMKNDPHSLVGAILAKTTDQSSIIYGTGMLISPDLVLTCAHNIFN